MSPTQLYAAVLAGLFFKMMIPVTIQITQRLKHRAFTTPEDARVWGRGSEVLAQEIDSVALATKNLRNDLENIPMFALLALAYLQLGCWETGAWIYFVGFLITRYLHTVFFLRRAQPWRTVTYTIGALFMSAMAVHILLKAFAAA